MKFPLYAALAAITVGATPALAANFTLVCDNGARVTTQMYTYKDGSVSFGNDPIVVSATCRNGNDVGPTVYVLPGLPGEYNTAGQIQSEVQALKNVVESPALKDAAVDNLPLALQFVKKLVDNNAAIEARKRTASGTPLKKNQN